MIGNPSFRRFLVVAYVFTSGVYFCFGASISRIDAKRSPIESGPAAIQPNNIDSDAVLGQNGMGSPDDENHGPTVIIEKRKYNPEFLPDILLPIPIIPEPDCAEEFECPTGWTLYENNCYFHLPEIFTDQQHAAAACRRKHPSAKLPAFKDKKEWDDFKDFVNSNKLTQHSYVWLSGNDRHKEGTIVHEGHNNCSQSYIAWTAPEPNNLENEDCIMRQHDKFIDISCHIVKFDITAVCQIRSSPLC